MAKAVKETTVTIGGSSIQLRTDMNPEVLERLAHYVDDKIRELDPKGKLPPGKVSVLASLSIAGELMDERSRSRESRREIARRLERLHELLDEALGGR